VEVEVELADSIKEGSEELAMIMAGEFDSVI
jgi:hypothetical protein